MVTVEFNYRNMPAVNAEILVWARETAGLTREEAARKLSFQDSSRSSASQKLELLESGHKEPTRTQLVKMSEQYRRPLVTFYLSTPPEKGDRGADFRSLTGNASPREDALLDALVRDIRARQSMVRALLEDDEDFSPLDFVGSLNIGDGQTEVLGTLRSLLGVDISSYRNQSTAKGAFDLLRGEAERVGVFVILQGNLGSHHTNLDVESFRGFSIADPIAPFVVINPQDARPALTFTLLHELVHIILGQTGISASHSENSIEQFCDSVAAQYLLPPTELASLFLDTITDLDQMSERISKFANDRHLSRTMVAYNAFLSNFISKETYQHLQGGYRKQWLDQRRLDKEREVRINPDRTRRYQIGASLMALVSRMTATGELTTSKAATVLGVRAGRVDSLLSITR